MEQPEEGVEAERRGNATEPALLWEGDTGRRQAPHRSSTLAQPGRGLSARPEVLSAGGRDGDPFSGG